MCMMINQKRIKNRKQGRIQARSICERLTFVIRFSVFNKFQLDQINTYTTNKSRVTIKIFIPAFHQFSFLTINIMSRLEQLLEKQLNKPHKYTELKENPFPYLQDCNRLEIFQFIFQLEAQNQQLAKQVSHKYPHKSLEQCMEEHKALQAKRRLIEINKETIEKMDIEIKEKREEVQRLKQKNIALQIESLQLTQSSQRFQTELIQVEKEKRYLEMKLKMQKDRQSKNVDLSAILTNMYKQVKQTLNQSL